MIEVSFKSEEARIKGISTLLHLPYAFKGLERNKFLIEDIAFNAVKDLISINE